MSFMSFASEMLGNLFKPPATSQYPFKPRKVYEADRGKVINDINKCMKQTGARSSTISTIVSSAVCACGTVRPTPLRWTGMPAPGRLIALPVCSAKSA